MPSFLVKIDRATDDSRTYKGPLVLARAVIEANSWRDSFPTYGVDVVPYDGDDRADFLLWQRVTRPTRPGHQNRYYPAATAAAKEHAT